MSVEYEYVSALPVGTTWVVVKQSIVFYCTYHVSKTHTPHCRPHLDQQDCPRVDTYPVSSFDTHTRRLVSNTGKILVTLTLLPPAPAPSPFQTHQEPPRPPEQQKLPQPSWLASTKHYRPHADSLDGVPMTRNNGCCFVPLKGPLFHLQTRTGWRRQSTTNLSFAIVLLDARLADCTAAIERKMKVEVDCHASPARHSGVSS